MSKKRFYFLLLLSVQNLAVVKILLGASGNGFILPTVSIVCRVGGLKSGRHFNFLNDLY